MMERMESGMAFAGNFCPCCQSDIANPFLAMQTFLNVVYVFTFDHGSRWQNLLKLLVSICFVVFAGSSLGLQYLLRILLETLLCARCLEFRLRCSQVPG